MKVDLVLYFYMRFHLKTYHIHFISTVWLKDQLQDKSIRKHSNIKKKNKITYLLLKKYKECNSISKEESSRLTPKL